MKGSIQKIKKNGSLYALLINEWESMRLEEQEWVTACMLTGVSS